MNLAQVDAVVTDAKGHPARGLEAADFEILEDGRPQVITNFAETGGLFLLAGGPPSDINARAVAITKDH